MMHSSLEALPDLDGPLWVPFAFWFVVAAILVVILWRIESRKRAEGTDHDRADADRRADRTALRAGPAVSGDRHEPARAHRLVHRDHGGGHGADRDRLAGTAGPHRLDLAPSELIALARWIDNPNHAVDVRALERAVTQIGLAADDVLHADRASRRG